VLGCLRWPLKLVQLTFPLFREQVNLLDGIPLDSSLLKVQTDVMVLTASHMAVPAVDAGENRILAQHVRQRQLFSEEF